MAAAPTTTGRVATRHVIYDLARSAQISVMAESCTGDGPCAPGVLVLDTGDTEQKAGLMLDVGCMNKDALVLKLGANPTFVCASSFEHILSGAPQEVASPEFMREVLSDMSTCNQVRLGYPSHGFMYQECEGTNVTSMEIVRRISDNAAVEYFELQAITKDSPDGQPRAAGRVVFCLHAGESLTITAEKEHASVQVMSMDPAHSVVARVNLNAGATYRVPLTPGVDCVAVTYTCTMKMTAFVDFERVHKDSRIVRNSVDAGVVQIMSEMYLNVIYLIESCKFVENALLTAGTTGDEATGSESNEGDGTVDG